MNSKAAPDSWTDNPLTDPVRRFIERMGDLAEEQGLPRTAGRLNGLLFMQTKPRSLDELTELLEVSKVSVSVNARMLEKIGLVQRVKLPGDRRDYYCVADDVEVNTLRVSMQLINTLTERLREGLAAASPETVRRRFERLLSFHEGTLEMLEERLRGYEEQRPR